MARPSTGSAVIALARPRKAGPDRTAGGGTRTLTELPQRDFESRASANSATPARACRCRSQGSSQSAPPPRGNQARRRRAARWAPFRDLHIAKPLSRTPSAGSRLTTLPGCVSPGQPPPRHACRTADAFSPPMRCVTAGRDNTPHAAVPPDARANGIEVSGLGGTVQLCWAVCEQPRPSEARPCHPESLNPGATRH